MRYIKQDLTPKGLIMFQPLIGKFAAFYDSDGKTDLQKMLKKWLAEMEENC